MISSRIAALLYFICLIISVNYSYVLISPMRRALQAVFPFFIIEFISYCIITILYLLCTSHFHVDFYLTFDYSIAITFFIWVSDYLSFHFYYYQPVVGVDYIKYCFYPFFSEKNM